MSMTNGRMTAFGAGLMRLLAERQIAEGKLLSAAEIAREASRDGGPVQPRAPRSMILGLGGHNRFEVARLLGYLGVTIEDVERIGNGEHAVLADVVSQWNEAREAER